MEKVEERLGREGLCRMYKVSSKPRTASFQTLLVHDLGFHANQRSNLKLRPDISQLTPEVQLPALIYREYFTSTLDLTKLRKKLLRDLASLPKSNVSIQ